MWMNCDFEGDWLLKFKSFCFFHITKHVDVHVDVVDENDFKFLSHFSLQQRPATELQQNFEIDIVSYANALQSSSSQLQNIKCQ